jgi:hypothetical protein
MAETLVFRDGHWIKTGFFLVFFRAGLVSLAELLS